MTYIESLQELASILNEQPARYIPLANGIACPFCCSFLYDEINTPEENVRKMKCQECSGIFYFDYRDK